MEFKLHYQGKVKSNGNAAEKHAFREMWHLQLKELWKYKPMSGHPDWLQMTPSSGEFSAVRNVGGHDFAPVVAKGLSMYAELDILFLQKDIMTGIGDIDNKLKTLFDGLRCPKVPNEIPTGWTPGADHHPLVCLLEDDELITRFNIHVDRLLKPLPKDEMVVLINVKVKGVVANFGNIGLIV